MGWSFPLLIKPAGADCNLRCSYCFYLEKAGLYPGGEDRRMRDEVLERLVGSYMALDMEVHAFIWQGGEPALMGPDFYRRAAELQARYGRPGAVVANSIQTNGTLIDDEFARVLAEFRFLAGVSLDGPEDVHDRFRRKAGGGGSHAEVMRGIEALQRRGVAFNVLVLVTSANVRRPAEIYRWLVSRGFFHHQYIPCVEFDGAGKSKPWSVSAGEWGSFLNGVFAEWIHADVRRVSVRTFDSVIRALAFGEADACSMGRDCRRYFLVERNGDIYPCDFFADEAFRIGNVGETSWEAALDSPAYAAFGACKSRLDAECSRCRHLDLCAGDCLKHRRHSGRPPENRSALCGGWMAFYDAARPAFEAIAKSIRAEGNNSDSGGRSGFACE